MPEQLPTCTSVKAAAAALTGPGPRARSACSNNALASFVWCGSSCPPGCVAVLRLLLLAAPLLLLKRSATALNQSQLPPGVHCELGLQHATTQPQECRE